MEHQKAFITRVKPLNQTPKSIEAFAPPSTSFPIHFDNSAMKQNMSSNQKGCPLKVYILLVTVIILALAIIGLGLYFAITLLEKDKTTSRTDSTYTTTTSTTTIVPGCGLQWNKTGITVAGTTSCITSAVTCVYEPYDLALNTINTLYIAEYGNNRIQRWFANSVSGNTIAGQSNGAAGSTTAHLNRPGGVFVDSSSNIYVADTLNHRVVYWPSGFKMLGTGASGSGTNQFSYPYGIARDSRSGALYISDYANHRVIRYSADATVVSVIAGGKGAGVGSGQLCEPFGIYFHAASNSLLIANSGANNIVRWVIWENSWTLAAGSLTGISGSSATLLSGPRSVTLDSNENMYVADTLNHRIQLFRKGETVGTTIAGVSGIAINSPNYLNGPSAVKLDAQYRLYVADTKNNRIQRFDCY